MTKPRADQDSPWKLVLRQYFHEAIEFFFPKIAQIIDWTQPIEFLDKEFQRITPDAALGKRYVDQLVKVQPKRGQALILLIHLEIQAAPEQGFSERMFIYAVRIFEYFHQPPISLAILGDARPDWRPQSYRFTTAGSSLEFNFTAVKLLDYQTQWAQLAQSRNPFAHVVMAHLKTQETKKDATDRKTWKFTLVKRLYELGYSRADVLNLFKFTDWIMILPEGLKRAFWEELRVYEEERKMPYITSVEQIGYERGVKEEAQRSVEREKALILRQLTRRVGELPKRSLTQINALSIEQLEALGEALLDFTGCDELKKWLKENS
jgi:Domain of unknown function (DUF4351)